MPLLIPLLKTVKSQGRYQMTTQRYQTLTLDRSEPHILTVTLNRPDAANAFNTVMADELAQCFEALTADFGDIRVVILTGAGSKAFCAGGDLKERLDMTDEAWFIQHRSYERMVRNVMGCPLPVIGAINGAAFGGGCELVAMLDFAYASTTARFAQTEVRLGIIPGAGGSQNLVRAIGLKRAKQLILTGETFSAEQAYDWGLINQLCAPEQLMDEVKEVARQIARNAPIAVRQSKMAVSRAPDLSLADGLMFEIEAYNRCVTTKDRREGLKAFNEKRRPEFTGQ